MILPWVLCVCFILVIAVLAVKLIRLHRTMDEICTELKEKMDIDTNTLITISNGSRHMRRLAAELNIQLRLLVKERRRQQSCDFELKEAMTNISHDLRTPLTAICGYLDLLKSEEKSEAADRYLSIIENRAKVLKQLMEELFQYSVITSTIDHSTYEIVTINSVLEESVSAYYAALKGRGIVPSISIPNQKIKRKLDRKALSRVFGNIIGNAIKYSGGDLQIVMSENGDIMFSNSAPQMDEIQVGKLFDRFYTVDDAKKSTGLGLSIAKTLTEQMNGKINAEYKNGKLNIHIAF